MARSGGKRRKVGALEARWEPAPVAAEPPPEPEANPWLARCGPCPEWLVLGALVRFPGTIGNRGVCSVRPGETSWEAMPTGTAWWFPAEALELVAPPPEGYNPWPGTAIHLKL